MRYGTILGTLLLIFIGGCATTGTTGSETAVASAEPARVYSTVGDPGKLNSEQPTVFITGANRGIGLEFVRQFSERGWNIIATARNPGSSTELLALADGYPRLIVEELDVTDHDRIDGLALKYAATPVDILLSNAGITPRYKSAFAKVEGVDWDMALQSYEVNAMAPLKLAQSFMDHVAASNTKKIVVISSKAGSFELSPEMPMMYSYRASKAALNMYMYALSFETVKQGITVTLLSPGQVSTTPGFKMKGAIEPEESVSKMLAVIDGLTSENNGQFLDYEDGRVLGW